MTIDVQELHRQKRELREQLEAYIREHGVEAGTRRYIGRCAKSGCHSTIAVDVPQERVIGYSGMWPRLVTRDVVNFRKAAPPCSHGSTRYKPVVGRVTDTVCGPRCTGATGPNCECKCGGANHGSAHLA